MNEYSDDGIKPVIHNLPIPHELANNAAKHRAIIFMSLITTGMLFYKTKQYKYYDNKFMFSCCYGIGCSLHMACTFN